MANQKRDVLILIRVNTHLPQDFLRQIIRDELTAAEDLEFAIVEITSTES